MNRTIKRQKIKHKRYKLLLDENIGARAQYPHLNNFHDVKHIKLDLHKGGIKDPDVYLIATQEKRLIVTINEKDFFSLAPKSRDTGIIILSPNLTFLEADRKLCALFRKKTTKELYGKVNKIVKR